MLNMSRIGEGILTHEPHKVENFIKSFFSAVFAPVGATLYTDQDKIWHGKIHRVFTRLC